VAEATDNDKLAPWWRTPSVWVMLLLGFSAGVPILLIFSSLSLWLREAGVAKSSVTFFSWAALGYSFKFVWAPLVDKLPIPILSQLMGRRRSWLLLSQIAVIGSILLMASTDPKFNLTLMALAAIALGFSSATQDIVVDAFRIESADKHLLGMLSSTYVAGYRIGMIVAGAGALYLADFFGSDIGEAYVYEAWRNTYFYMAMVMLVGVLTTLMIKEPNKDQKAYPYSAGDYAKFFLLFALFIIAFIFAYRWFPNEIFGESLGPLGGFLLTCLRLLCALLVAFFVAKLLLYFNFARRDLFDESYVAPLVDFVQRYGKLAIWVLLLVGFYRVSDIVLGVIANVFYQDMGYSKTQIASLTKVFGVIITILGSFLGGVLTLRYGVMRMLLTGAILVVATNLLFMWIAGLSGQHHLVEIGSMSVPLELSLVIIADNLSGGIAIAAFIAWLSSLTNVSFTATQYALFSSLMTLFPKVLGGYSGTIVEAIGYSNFFLICSLLGMPVVLLVLYLMGKKELR
jgi:PAT family beta-lactamase induction signal transducer AmpG